MSVSNDGVRGQDKIARLYGVVSCVRAARGFAFAQYVTQDGRRRSVFFAFGACFRGEIPSLGDAVSFRLSKDREDRDIAVDVRIEKSSAL
jgi:hypothetical protein